MTAPGWLTAKPIAHRGLHGPGVPENSLAAIEAALAAGYPIELDLQLSADGRVIVCHDENLERLTGLKEKVSALPASRLSDLRLLDTDQKIPLIADVLDLVRSREGLLLEIKGRNLALAAETARLLHPYRGNYAIQAFAPQILIWFGKNAPNIPRGQLSSGWTKSKPWTIFSGNYVKSYLTRPHFIAHQWQKLPSVATTWLRKKGLPLLAWTVTSPADRATALQHADNIIFEQFRP